MGIYDRDYERNYDDRQGSFSMASQMSLTTKIVIVMCAVYVVQLLTRVAPRDPGWFTSTFSLYPNVFVRPLHLFQLLTYGFLHDPDNLKHIVGNMIGLWFLGRSVEYRYGPREYLAFFLVAIVAGGLAWELGELVANHGFAPRPAMLGASGGVVAVIILFALNFPHQTVLFMFFLPMPMWVAGLIIVGMDAFGAVQRTDNVAFTAHLGGALFAFVYFKMGWQLESLVSGGNLLKRLRPRPKLRVVDPDEPDDSIEDQVDAILKKIQDHGRDSLTRGERRILEEASREYQKRRK